MSRMRSLNMYVGFTEPQKCDIAYFKHPKETVPFVLTFAFDCATRTF